MNYPTLGSMTPTYQGSFTSPQTDWGTSTLSQASFGMSPTQQGYQNILGTLGSMFDQTAMQQQPQWVNDYLNPALKGIGGLATLGNLYMGFQGMQNQNKYMGMMKDQLSMAKEQWQTTKDEINRIKEVRKKINASY